MGKLSGVLCPVVFLFKQFVLKQYIEYIVTNTLAVCTHPLPLK